MSTSSDGESEGSGKADISHSDTVLATESSLGLRALGAREGDAVVDAAMRNRIFEAVLDEPAPRQRLGRYAILGTLGQGGMGTVLEAFDRTLDRRVALKVLHGDLAERHRTRLIREAQALAKLSHPHVVQVYEVGEAEGQTFVAMELAEGRTLQAWVRQEPRPSWREIVGVYQQAGEGLAAAHAAGLVHRDFKPDNACIDDEGRVRVIDFGLARQAGDPGEEPDRTRVDLTIEFDAMDTPLTRTGTVLGTPAYMPLEQMRGHGADARSDQFSFCVSLWEALAGERPFEGKSIAALAMALTEGKPRVPSTGRELPTELRRALTRGLATKPEDRWPSMDALLAELARVLSKPRRMATLGLTGVALVTVGGLLWGQGQAPRPCEGGDDPFAGIWDDDRREQVRTAILGTELSYAEDTWSRVEERLDAYTRDWTTAHTDACEDTHVRKEQSEAVMALRMRCLSTRRTATREATEVLASASATVVDRAVDLVDGLPRLSRCEEIEALEAEVPPPEDPQVAEEVEALRGQLSRALHLEEAGEYERSESEAHQVLERAEALDYAPLVAEALLARGLARDKRGRYEEAEQDLQRAYVTAVGERHEAVEIEAVHQLVWVVGVRQARPAQGQQWGTVAQALVGRPGVGDVTKARVWHSVGIAARQRGELDEALEDLRRALAVYEEALGPEHSNVASTLGNIGSVLRAQGKTDEALAHQQRALEITERALGSRHPRLAGVLNNIGASLRAQGKTDEALAYLERALAINEEALGKGHPQVAASLNNIGNVLKTQGKTDEALAYLERALSIWEQTHGEEHPNVASSLTNIGNVLHGLGRLDEALARLERALRIAETLSGPEHPDVASARSSIGVVLVQQGRLDEALAQQKQALAIFEKALGPDDLNVASSLNNLAEVLLAQGRPGEALRDYQRALSLLEAALGSEHPNVGSLHVNIGLALRRLGSLDEAREHQQQALSIFEKALGPEHPNVAYPLVELANIGVERGETEDARVLAERAVKLRAGSSTSPAVRAEAEFALARVRWANPETRADAWAAAERAREDLEGIGRQEADRWLAEHAKD